MSRVKISSEDAPSAVPPALIFNTFSRAFISFFSPIYGRSFSIFESDPINFNPVTTEPRLDRAIPFQLSAEKNH